MVESDIVGIGVMGKGKRRGNIALRSADIVELVG